MPFSGLLTEMEDNIDLFGASAESETKEFSALKRSSLQYANGPRPMRGVSQPSCEASLEAWDKFA